MPAPFVLCFCLLLIQDVGINKQEDGRPDQWDEKEPECRHAAKDAADERQHTGSHEECGAQLMGLIPNIVAAQCPWRADADEEVALCLAEHETNEDEE